MNVEGDSSFRKLRDLGNLSKYQENKPSRRGTRRSRKIEPPTSTLVFILVNCRKIKAEY